jgi:hypothetical protein
MYTRAATIEICVLLQSDLELKRLMPTKQHEYAPILGSKRPATAVSVFLPAHNLLRSLPVGFRKLVVWASYLCVVCLDGTRDGNGKRIGAREACYWITHILALRQQQQV